MLFALDTLGVRDEDRSRVVARWQARGCPALAEFAPYAHYVAQVDLFFYVAIAADLISRERPSNRVDMAYLYYLPFCMVFTSNDNLHRRVAPIFLDDEQTFVDGTDLKRDLARLESHYAELPEQERLQGVLRFAPHPPLDESSLTTRLWDKYLPRWRPNLSMPPDEQARERVRVRVGQTWKQVSEGGRSMEPPVTNPDFYVVKNMVPLKKGRWFLLPAAFAERAQKHRDDQVD